MVFAQRIDVDHGAFCQAAPVVGGDPVTPGVVEVQQRRFDSQVLLEVLKQTPDQPRTLFPGGLGLCCRSEVLDIRTQLQVLAGKALQHRVGFWVLAQRRQVVPILICDADEHDLTQKGEQGLQVFVSAPAACGNCLQKATLGGDLECPMQ